MQLVTREIGNLVAEELRQTAQLTIAMAYFRPDDQTLSLLRKVSKLRIIISEEFTINNPNKLKKLTSRGQIKCVPPDSKLGKLHAKVIYGTRKDASQFALLGSANITYTGLFSNQEACILFDSRREEDKTVLNNISTWLELIWNRPDNGSIHKFDFKKAKAIFDNYSPNRRKDHITTMPNVKKGKARQNFWVLKTTNPSSGEDHWKDFQAEGVIAIGWENIDVDPAKVTKEELWRALREAYRGIKDRKVPAKIKDFIGIDVNDLVLICRGYIAKSDKPVHIYGVARVTSKFISDRSSSWWKFKHKAIIQTIDQPVPKSLIVSCLKKQQLIETIHKINVNSFERLSARLYEEHGIRIDMST